MVEENIEKDMTPVLLEDLGLRYPTEKSKQRYRYGLYQCQYCGKEFEAKVHQIKHHRLKSCGCLLKAKNKKGVTKHGLSHHPLYRTWVGIWDRCNNHKTKHYEDYGGRGIKVCERWLNIKNFIEDMYPSWEKGLSLDRVNNNGNYEPDNCRWTDASTQARNTRVICSTNTSGFRGVSWHKTNNMWTAQIGIEYKLVHLGSFHTALEAAKAYERYVRLNNLEHNFTPTLTEEEIAELS